MALTATEKTAFAQDGLLVRRGAVPADLITRAQELVTHWYRTSMNPELLHTYTQRTFAPELGNHPDLLALFDQSPAADLARELLGDLRPVTTVQLQIRIPTNHPNQQQPEKAMHVDGVACPHLDPEELRTFSLLAGVVLSDITDPDGGALHYQPGGHLAMAHWFRTQWKLGITDQVPPDLDAQTGTPLLGSPGDLLLMHHLVPHAVGRNTSTSARIMAYFRIEHPDHTTHRLQALKDPWLDYTGLHPAA